MLPRTPAAAAVEGRVEGLGECPRLQPASLPLSVEGDATLKQASSSCPHLLLEHETRSFAVCRDIGTLCTPSSAPRS